MQISVLNKNIRSMSVYLSRGGLRGENTWSYLSRELPKSTILLKKFSNRIESPPEWGASPSAASDGPKGSIT